MHCSMPSWFKSCLVTNLLIFRFRKPVLHKSALFLQPLPLHLTLVSVVHNHSMLINSITSLMWHTYLFISIDFVIVFVFLFHFILRSSFIRFTIFTRGYFLFQFEFFIICDYNEFRKLYIYFQYYYPIILFYHYWPSSILVRLFWWESMYSMIQSIPIYVDYLVYADSYKSGGSIQMGICASILGIL